MDFGGVSICKQTHIIHCDPFSKHLSSKATRVISAPVVFGHFASDDVFRRWFQGLQTEATQRLPVIFTNFSGFRSSKTWSRLAKKCLDAFLGNTMVSKPLVGFEAESPCASTHHVSSDFSVPLFDDSSPSIIPTLD